jgi:hypothetical protein
MAASPAALPAPRATSSPVTRRRRPAAIKTLPITPMSTPTVFTSQRSTFGPVTASNVRMLRSGHTPVVAKYTPWTSAIAEARVTMPPAVASRLPPTRRASPLSHSASQCAV